MKSPHSLIFSLAAASLLLSSTVGLASETDNRIESAARRSYVFKTYLKNESIRTDSRDGVVTLSGSVAEASHRALAESTVESLPGVTRVDNQLTIQKESPAEHSDGWLATKVKGTLLFHRNVRGTKTSVEVMDGVVILTGEALNLAQKDLTSEYASDVEGVKKVVNQMTVSRTPELSDTMPSEEIDDASITAQVRMSLMSRRSTSALKTQVSTSNGVVTVGGIARNAAEKSLVTKVVTDIHGVVSVINNMTVAPPVATH